MSIDKKVILDIVILEALSLQKNISNKSRPKELEPVPGLRTYSKYQKNKIKTALRHDTMTNPDNASPDHVNHVYNCVSLL